MSMRIGFKNLTKYQGKRSEEAMERAKGFEPSTSSLGSSHSSQLSYARTERNDILKGPAKSSPPKGGDHPGPTTT